MSTLSADRRLKGASLKKEELTKQIVAIFRTGRGLQGKQTFLVKAEKQSITSSAGMSS